MIAANTIGWLELAATVALGIVGLYFAHSYRRQLRLNLANDRIEAYGRLWALTEKASPSRLGTDDPPLKDLKDRKTLLSEITAWYYEGGNGMLLANDSRNIFLKAKTNLKAEVPQDLDPKELVGYVRRFPGFSVADDNHNALFACLAVRQLSLLRSQMKADLAIYGKPYSSKLKDHEAAFLTACDVSFRHRLWRKALPLSQQIRVTFTGRPDPEALGSEDCGS